MRNRFLRGVIKESLTLLLGVMPLLAGDLPITWDNRLLVLAQLNLSERTGSLQGGDLLLMKYHVGTLESAEFYVQAGGLFHLAEHSHEASWYRAYVGWSRTQDELRLGLQRLAFGPVRLLRVFQWFDTLDPRDPFRLSEGVKALLYRRGVGEAAEFWSWIIYDHLPWPHAVPGDYWQTGGRYQFYMGQSEMGLTVHQVRPSSISDPPTVTRVAIDARWDLLAEVYLEVFGERFHLDSGAGERIQGTVGLSYTWPYGNGWYTGWETSWFWENGQELRLFHALQVSYPLGFFDQLQLIGFYYTGNSFWYLAWTRTLDHWLLSLALGGSSSATIPLTFGTQDSFAEWSSATLLLFGEYIF